MTFRHMRHSRARSALRSPARRMRAASRGASRAGNASLHAAGRAERSLLPVFKHAIEEPHEAEDVAEPTVSPRYAQTDNDSRSQMKRDVVALTVRARTEDRFKFGEPDPLSDTRPHCKK